MSLGMISFSTPMYLTRTFLIFVFLFLTRALHGAPWIDADNGRLRSHVELLADAGYLDVSVTTWPLLWSDLASQLDKSAKLDMPSALRLAVYELKFELRRQSGSAVKRSIKLDIANGRKAFDMRPSGETEKYALQKQLDWDGKSLALRLQGNLRSNGERSSFESTLEGSYFVGNGGGWLVGAGSIDRWWGPGNVSSLILSHNARPQNGLLLRTMGDQKFKSEWLSWIGAWQFVGFISQLEESRAIPEAKLTGMRLTSRPLKDLELGVSRVMMWGGKGRDNNLSAFWRSFTASEENTEDGEGNQLGGFDARYSFEIPGHIRGAVYGQLIGEDEAGALPSKYLSLFGGQVSVFSQGGNYFSGYLEYSDTAAGSLNEPQYGAAYGHSTFTTGYRYRGKAIGSAFDGDARSISLGTQVVMSDQKSVRAGFSKSKLNRAGGSAGNTLVEEPLDIYAADVVFDFLLLGGRGALAYRYVNKARQLAVPGVVKHGVAASWQYRY